MDSIFTKIIKREIPSKILYEDDKVIAIYDAFPKNEGHFLVIPKVQKDNILQNTEEEFLYAMKISRELAQKEIIDKNRAGFKIVINTGKAAGQEVFHTHIHVIPYDN
ncbi:histidine triad protein HinT [Mycoplasmopsis verecunda]|uniref:Histidine triad (HIT) family protein n=1 Tax=Mycoplasmopsis verecunda TaxID=171291 RepID=A0A1T4LU04_9BACT|nr:HIT family protein [Mycoplasmopsis verecunda]WPB54556.1 HIT family protein [Mycoplasmopsis verecunda]SJZ58121.1 histidine triad (HIT) family protein [Mycoplasmopsis verecunda]